MNDVFVEQIIERKQDFRTSVKKMLLILAAIVVSTIFLIVGAIRFIFPGVFALSMYLAIRAAKKLNIEYEYSFTNGELDIDKIMGRRSRRRELSFHVRSIILLATFTEENYKDFESRNFATTLDASSSPKSESRWFAVYRDIAGNESLLIFEPNERLLSAMEKYIPSSRIKK